MIQAQTSRLIFVNTNAALLVLGFWGDWMLYTLDNCSFNHFDHHVQKTNR